MGTSACFCSLREYKLCVGTRRGIAKHVACERYWIYNTNRITFYSIARMMFDEENQIFTCILLCLCVVIIFVFLSFYDIKWTYTDNK